MALGALNTKPFEPKELAWEAFLNRGFSPERLSWTRPRNEAL